MQLYQSIFNGHKKLIDNNCNIKLLKMLPVNVIHRTLLTQQSYVISMEPKLYI